MTARNRFGEVAAVNNVAILNAALTRSRSKASTQILTHEIPHDSESLLSDFQNDQTHDFYMNFSKSVVLAFE